MPLTPPCRVRVAYSKATGNRINYASGARAKTVTAPVDFLMHAATNNHWVYLNSFDPLKVDKQKLQAQELDCEAKSRMWLHVEATTGRVLKHSDPARRALTPL